MEYLWPLLLTIHVTLVPVQWTEGSIGQNSSSFFLVLMLTEASFTISDSIKPWWIWVYWISPLSYGQRAIAVNEFTDSRWREVYFIFNFFSDDILCKYHIFGSCKLVSLLRQKSSYGTDTVGNNVLRSQGLPTQRYWYWVGVGILLAYSILFNILFILAMAYLKRKPPIFV